MTQSQPAPPKRIAIIGGGFTGLAAAHRLHELAPGMRISLFEASDRIGGVVRTEQHSGFLIEHGADMFTTREPWALDLCRRIDFERELINTNSQHARAFVVRRGRLYPVPAGFTLMTPARIWPIVKSPLLSVAGKLRMAAEYFIPPRRDGQDESLAQFATRRLGQQAYERLVQPLIGGIYTADPTKLSMQAALPQFVQMEQQYGSLLRAIRQKRNVNGQAIEKTSGARYGLFVAPSRGMESLLHAIARRLPDSTIRLSAPVHSLAKTDGNAWEIVLRGSAHVQRFDAVLIATPSHVAADLLEAAAPPLAAELRSIPYASAAVVALAFRRDQFRHPLDGFGLVVPQTENRRILAASLSSVKFEGRAPADCVLLRVFIGGACAPELADLPESELEQLALQELRELLGLSGQPLLSRVIRWTQSMPQYHVGHLDRVARIEQAVDALPSVALAGNAYRGVGIPYCIHSGELAAERILANLRSNQ